MTIRVFDNTCVLAPVSNSKMRNSSRGRSPNPRYLGVAQTHQGCAPGPRSIAALGFSGALPQTPPGVLPPAPRSSLVLTPIALSVPNESPIAHRTSTVPARPSVAALPSLASSLNELRQFLGCLRFRLRMTSNVSAIMADRNRDAFELEALQHAEVCSPAPSTSSTWTSW